MKAKRTAVKVIISICSLIGVFYVVRAVFPFLWVLILILGSGIRPWDSKPGHYIRGTNAMTGVSAFIAANGWNSSTNEDDLDRWEDLKPLYINNLPWSRCKDRQFQALTYNGILYVLSNPGWHHDYAGVAYNPTTNRFPELMLNGFKPIGGHWYVWCSLEFNPQGLPKKYE